MIGNNSLNDDDKIILQFSLSPSLLLDFLCTLLLASHMSNALFGYLTHCTDVSLQLGEISKYACKCISKLEVESNWWLLIYTIFTILFSIYFFYFLIILQNIKIQK